MLKLTAAYCFAGGGGDCWGSVCAGYSPLWAIEKDFGAAAVFRRRFPDCRLIEADITELSDEFLSTLPVPSLYIFGSPCPDFSTAGRRAGIAGTRGSLFYEGLRPLRLLQIPYFIFENVEGILSSSSHPARHYAARIVQRYETGGWGISKETYAIAKSVKKCYQGSDFKRILWEFEQLGYSSTWQLRNGNRWVPQNRRRVFVIGRHRECAVSQNRAG